MTRKFNPRRHKFNAKRTQGFAPRPSDTLLWYASKAEADYAGTLRLRQMASPECAEAVAWWSPQPNIPLPRPAGALRRQTYIGDFFTVAKNTLPGRVRCYAPCNLKTVDITRIAWACEALGVCFSTSTLDSDRLERVLSPWLEPEDRAGSDPHTVLIRDLRVWSHGESVASGVQEFVLPFVVADFCAGEVSVIDVKGFKTREYLRKRRAVKEIYGLDIIEAPVRAARAPDRRGRRRA